LIAVSKISVTSIKFYEKVAVYSTWVVIPDTYYELLR